MSGDIPSMKPTLLNPEEFIRTYFETSASVKQRTGAQCTSQIIRAAQMVVESLRSGGKLLICGNGGSAADAQHLAGEFVSVLSQTNLRPALAAIALTTDTSILTSISNDFGYEGVFARQVEALGRPGDILLGITTTGNSKNVLRAFESAKTQGVQTIALTGGHGGRIATLADLCICVPSDNVQHIQESHLAVEHALTALVETALFGTK